MGLLDRQRQWEQEQFLKFAGLLSRWRDDPKAAAEQIPQDLSTGARNVGAMTAGLLGDIDPMIGPGGAAGDAINAMGITERARIVPNSEELVDTFGGDREHFSYYPSMVVAPGPGEAAAGVKGLLGSGKAALASLKGSMDLAPGGLLAQALFHGTPHKFSKFELEKIGTGEGAQAYGHGLYFAESPGVAKSYQSNIVDQSRAVKFDGNTYTFSELLDTGDALLDNIEAAGFSREAAEGAMSSLATSNGSISKAKKALDNVPENMRPYLKQDVLDEQKRILDRFESTELKGHLYEVDLPDETIAKMLDWDAPLSEQPESVRKVVRGFRRDLDDWLDKNADFEEAVFSGTPVDVDSMTGEQIYKALSDAAGSDALPARFDKALRPDERTSQYLNEAGIPGIRFFDGSSRNLVGGRIMDIEQTGGKFRSKVEIPNNTRQQGSPQTITWSPKFDTEAEARKWADKKTSKGTRNIVVFNPDDIKTVKRDGELVYKTGGI